MSAFTAFIGGVVVGALGIIFICLITSGGRASEAEREFHGEHFDGDSHE